MNLLRHIVLLSSAYAQLDDIGPDVPEVPEEVGIIGDLVDEFQGIEGTPYYCIFGPDKEKIYTEDVVGEGIANTCAESCRCWELIEDCSSMDEINERGLDACRPVPKKKPANSPSFSGVTRIIYAFVPMLGWWLGQYLWKDTEAMKSNNFYYWHAWQLFWIGDLAMFLIPACLYIAVVAVKENYRVKFWFKWFC